MTRALVHANFRRFLDGQIPEGIEPVWYESDEEFAANLSDVEVVWPDYLIRDSADAMLGKVLEGANVLQWCSVMSSGVDWLPLASFRANGIMLTNGAGLHAHSVAEFALLGMLSYNKKWGQIRDSQARHEWLEEAPGTGELLDARVLVIGAGEIGQRIRTLLEAFDAQVTMARRTPQGRDLGQDEWRARLGEFDWVVLVVPSTPETIGMFGKDELSAMKKGAALVNVARGEVLDQDALLEALRSGHLGGAYLDVTDPEPLPADHPLWDCPNVEISMHCSGLAQSSLLRRAAARFLENLRRFQAGEELVHRVDFDRGY